MKSSTTIVALAGRRIDAPGTQPARFPESNIEKVCGDIRRFLLDNSVTTLVSSAACGADLLALDVAAGLGARCYVVLPLPRGEFRRVSVTDRPGNWGILFDRILDQVTESGDLVELQDSDVGDEAFSKASISILENALQLGREATPRRRVVALVIWDGKPRGNDDLTAEFIRAARMRGVAVAEILTNK